MTIGVFLCSHHSFIPDIHSDSLSLHLTSPVPTELHPPPDSLSLSSFRLSLFSLSLHSDSLSLSSSLLFVSRTSSAAPRRRPRRLDLRHQRRGPRPHDDRFLDDRGDGPPRRRNLRNGVVLGIGSGDLGGGAHEEVVLGEEADGGCDRGGEESIKPPLLNFSDRPCPIDSLSGFDRIWLPQGSIGSGHLGSIDFFFFFLKQKKPEKTRTRPELKKARKYRV